MMRSTSRGGPWRTTALALVGCLLLASCGGSATPASQPAGEPSAQHASPSPSTAATESQTAASPVPSEPALGPGPIAGVLTPVPADPGFAASIAELGLDEATAYFMAETVSIVTVVDAHTYEVHHAFPNGATSDVTYHLFQGGSIRPGDPPEFKGTAAGDEYHFVMRYAIDSSGLPGDLRQQVLTGLPTTAPTGLGAGPEAVSLIGLAPVRPAAGVLVADSGDTVGIVANGVISQGRTKLIGSLVKKAEEKGWTKTATAWKWISGARKVWDAVEYNDIITSALAEVEALRKCAQSPTNPVAKKEYAGDPSAQQRVLDDLARVEDEIRTSAMAMFTSKIAATGSSLAKGAPWLGFITTPANDYVKATQLELMKEYLRQAEQVVVRCTHSYAISGMIPSEPGGIAVSGKACSLERPFKAQTTGDLTGTFRFEPSGATGGAWDYRGVVSNAGFQTDGVGTYVVTLSDDGSAGTLGFMLGLTTHIPMVGDQSGNGPATLTLTAIPVCEE